MRFTEPLLEGTLIRRDRFMADVKLEDGEQVTVHCAHPGSLRGCAEPGNKVLVSTHNDSRRKFKHQLEIIFSGRTPVAVHSGRSGSVIAEAVKQGKVEQLIGYETLRRDDRVNPKARIDFVLEGNGMRRCYVQVKNVTFAHQNVAYYPDTVIRDGEDELAELTGLVRLGNRAMIVFLAQRSDCAVFKLADHIDEEYGQLFRDTMARGVEIAGYKASVTRKGIEFDGPLAIEVDED